VFIIKYKLYFFLASALMMLAAGISLAVFGLKFGIDFTGGTLVEVAYETSRPDQMAVESRLSQFDLGTYSIRPIGEDGYLLRSRELTPDEQAQVVETLSLNGANPAEIVRANTVGPVIGVELRNKAFVALAVVIGMIILYVAFTFRHVSKPVSSWIYGLIAIVTLIHDILIPAGIFAFLGYLVGAEVDILFVTALLTILGYSVNDTIVVFDRIRENLGLQKEREIEVPFDETVGLSLQQTFARSLNTSVTVFLVLVALYFFGAEATQLFILVLLAGVVAGAYSSLFVASPLLVAFEGSQRKEL
jgi:preprotein translocase subunit SecF